MDTAPVHSTPPIEEEDERDTDGFVIPSLGIGDSDQSKTTAQDIESSNSLEKEKMEENIYLGPHGAPPSQSKEQELNSLGYKQRFKQKLKEADKRIPSGTGRENKLDNLRELVGGGKISVNMAKSTSKDWLDPHCH
ncbi:Na-translocating NADH-quinone reductase subunit A [Quillaja saponaria]|uniref:Na-translocating NADH-quinone reductase subunit A n=1 Tax=Quillaja saponaria TaxID=32244 RepID=A0AAD7LQ36_QUISA|nr:Na-translocating NADH-quinone reductase subunit A [Quillaja saponaria]